MKRTTLNFVLALAMAALTGGAQAITHRCVSKDKSWSPTGITGTIVKYNNLQTAANAARNGDIVWVQDGFVMDSGQNSRTKSSGNGLARLHVGKSSLGSVYYYTVRSESGYVDEAAGRGVTIHCDNSTTARGENAMCPVRCDDARIVLMGLILEGGSTFENNDLKGGAVAGACVLTNCVIRNCEATMGGAIGDNATTMYNCVISNCVAYGSTSTDGGGAIYGAASLYGCKLIGNSATKSGGAVYQDGTANSVYSNCVFSGNSATSGGGLYLNGDSASVDHVKLMDCRITDNRSTAGGWGGVSGAATLTRCWIANNSVAYKDHPEEAHTGGVGAASESGTRPILTGCVISNNYALASGGGLYRCVATNCVLKDNIATDLDSGVGGGAYGSDLTLCDVVGNVSSNYGGGVASCNLMNCVVTNNWAKYYGAAASNPGAYTCCNCLFAHNACKADSDDEEIKKKGMILAGDTVPMTLVNCTVAGNETTRYGIIDGAMITNCIVWANVSVGKENPENELVDCMVGYSCQSELTSGENGNIKDNPNMTGDFHLATPQPCADVALMYDWMDNAADVRSRDADKSFRVCADGPDMGCFERKDTGIVIIVK